MDKRRRQRIDNRNRLKEWSKSVRAISKCSVCKRTDRLVAHHILPKDRYQDLKFELLNGICLCPKCHKYAKYSAHKNGIWFACWLMANCPEKYNWAVSRL
jgi:5-methylcytosine-specific restriction endonuclease McrA